MAKNSFSEWSPNPSDNTDVAGLSTLGSAPVSNFDNIVRTLMAQLKVGVVDLAGSRMIGPLQLGPASYLGIEDSTDGRYSWSIDSSDLLIGLYWNAELGLGTAGYKFRVTRDGAVNTAQLGDLKTYLDNLAATAAADATTKANARLALTGGILTGPLALSYTNPALILTNSGARSWHFQTFGPVLRIVDDTGGYSHTEFETDGNILFRAAPGGAIRLGTIITQAAAGNAARTLVDTKFENTRLTGSFNSGTNGGYDAPSGGVITGYSREEGAQGRVGSIRGKYLQSFAPSRGWVSAYNEG